MASEEVWYGDTKTSDVTLQLVPKHEGDLAPTSNGNNTCNDSCKHNHSSHVYMIDYPRHPSNQSSPHLDDVLRQPAMATNSSEVPGTKRGQPSKKRRKHSQQEATVLHVHSAALCRCQYFNACLGERWTKDADGTRPIQVTLEAHSYPSVYIRCIGLLYRKDLTPASTFHSVADALNVLRVAAQLLFQDCITSSMKYLAAMPWTSEEQATIHSAITCSHLPPSQDLAARLGTFNPPGGAMGIELSSLVKRVLENLLSSNTQQDCFSCPDRRAACEKVLRGNIQGPHSSCPMASITKSAMYGELHKILNKFRQQVKDSCWFYEDDIPDLSKAIVWLLNTMLDLNVGEDAVKSLSSDKELANIIASLLESIKSNFCNDFLINFCQVLVRMLHSVGNGDMIFDNRTRLALVETWLPILKESEFVIGDDLRDSAEKALNGALKTLPIFDQEQILTSWLSKERELDYSTWPNLSEAFEVWCQSFRSTMNLVGGAMESKSTIGCSLDSQLLPRVSPEINQY